MEKKNMVAGKSDDDLYTIKENYGKTIKNFNKQRKAGFKDFAMAWNGTCPGCAKCTNDGTHQPELEPKHAIKSMNTEFEALTIARFSELIHATNAELQDLQSHLIRKDAEKVKGKGKEKEVEGGKEEEGTETA